jgi:hypothetical protein
MLYGTPATIPPQNPGGVWRMVAAAATVTVQPADRITGMIAAPIFGTGAPPTFTYALCWRPVGSAAAPVLVLPPAGAAPTLTTSNGSIRGTHAVGGSTVPGVTGGIEVGLCVRDHSVGSGWGNIVVDVQTGFLTLSRD